MTIYVFTRKVLHLDRKSTERTTFTECRWHVDDAGTLYIFRHGSKEQVAAYARGTWDAVVRVWENS